MCIKLILKKLIINTDISFIINTLNQKKTQIILLKKLIMRAISSNF